MPSLRSRLIEEGASFENAFVSYPLCCPSRSTVLTGLYAHNHGVTTNEPPVGGFQRFRAEGHEENTIAVHLQQRGYTTGLFGKYLNGYPSDDPTHVPPGWDEWHAKVDANAEGDAKYYGYELNENGEVVAYGNSSGDYITDVLSGQAKDFIRRAGSGSEPFFLYLAPTAPHAPTTPAERHKDAFVGETAPRPPSFDERDVSDKPPWIRNIRRISDKQASRIDERYRERLASMLSVDEMLDSLLGELEATGQLDNTFVFFTSDNGWMQGEHRVKSGKILPYEEAIRTPLFVRGPRVTPGSRIEKPVLNTDFALTFADLAGVPLSADGRSFVPLLSGEDPPWRSAILLEGAGGGGPPSYRAIRTKTQKYVEYQTGDKELYDLEADPYELDNVYENADSSLVEDLETRLSALGSCAGKGCQEAEDTS